MDVFHISQGEAPLSEQDLKQQLEALDGSGVALRAKVLGQLKKDNWRVEKDVSVSAAPFLYDSVKPRETMRPENDAERGTKSRNGIVRIQNEHLRREASLDIVATSDSTRVLCVGIEKRDPLRENWVFANPDVDEGFPDASIENRKFVAVSRNSSSEQKSDDLLHVPESDSAPKGWAIRMEKVELLLETYRYDQGLSFQKNEGEYAPNRSLANASGRIIEGTFGLIVESLIRQVSSNEGRNEQKFIPIIVTTANILLCKHKENELIVDDAPKDAVVYNCPVPLRARFPGHIAGWDGRKYRSGRWPVLIVTPQGLDGLLHRL